MTDRISAIILLAGSGNRFGDPIPKQFHMVGEKELYRLAYETFQSISSIDEIILVCPSAYLDKVQIECPEAKVVAGGKTRKDSSYNGLLACNPKTNYVLIHDGARPFVSPEIIKENIRLVKIHGAVDTCIPATDTIVMSEGDGVISSIPERKTCYHGQTPQSFKYNLILEAHEIGREEAATDDCRLVHAMGVPVHIALGSEKNIKITSKTDLLVASSLINS